MKVLLNAMGLTLWGAVAITLALSMVVLGYRASLAHRPAGTQLTIHALNRSAAVGSGETERESQRKVPGSPEIRRAGAIRALLRGATEHQQYADAVVYGKELFEAGGADAADLTLLVHAYEAQKDCKSVVEWSVKAISASRKSGERPAAALYETQLQCASDAGNRAGMIAALENLIRLTNQSEYWNILIRLFRQDERDDHNLLMIYRVMYNTSAMNAGSDYIEMAQLLGDAGLPGEAQSILEKAASSGLIKEEEKDRMTRLAISLRIRAEAERNGMEREDARATESTAGDSDVKLGEMYYGFGDYKNAAAAIAHGLKKGGIKRLDEAYVYLGLAEGAIRDNAAARSAFAGLREVSDISPQVADLWSLYAEARI